MVKFIVKLKHCQIGIKIGVVVGIISTIMVVDCDKIWGNICGKIVKLEQKCV